MKKILAVVFILLLLIAGCSSDETIKKGEKEFDTDELFSADLNVKFNEVFSWINMMPGPKAEPRFNITGEIELYESDKYNLESIKLAIINIYQNDELIYSIKPEVRVDDNLSTDKMKFLIFSTIKGMLIENSLDTETVIDAKFIFGQDDDKYSYLIKNIKIDKAY